jgi:hypothetical protein
MLPVTSFPRERARALTAVFTDIDDTLTTDGQLPAVAYAALWRLRDAGVAVVPVTGRPAGWCDHLARFWPVAGVIGENGALYFRHEPAQGRLVQRFLLDAETRRGLQARLASLGERILREVPGCALASDQPYRIHDLAIDFCEDVPRLPEAAVDRIVALFAAAGATAKVSSIHVNGWFGDHDKLGMIRTFAREVLGLDLGDPAARARCVYVGDSPNDEPAFAALEGAVGVANVREHLHRLRHPPSYVTRARGGEGFAELADLLLDARR